jgi:enterochelin esterase-like enzyme
MLALHEQFVDLKLAHAWLTAPGGHGFGYWKTALEPALLFHLGTEVSEAV